MPILTTKDIDKTIGNGLQYVATPFTTIFETIASGIDKFGDISLDEEKDYKNEVPTLFDIAKKVINTSKTYHLRIAKHTSEWSDEAKKLVSKTLFWCFRPIEFSHIARVIRDTLAEKILGNIVKAVTFIAMQILHIFPYAFLSSAATEIYLLYQAAPVGFISTVGIGLGGLQVYFIYRAAKEIEVTTRILNDRLDPNNLVILAQNTLRSLGNLTKRTLRGTSTFIKDWSKWKTIILPSIAVGYGYSKIHDRIWSIL